MAMENTIIPISGQSVRSLQTFLRVISYYYKSAPIVIPDGIYGAQTQLAVSAFQQAFGLPETGEVNYDCWVKIVSVYDQIQVLIKEPEKIRLIPKAKLNIQHNAKGTHVIAVKGVLNAIGSQYVNFNPLTPSDIHEETSIEMVVALQKIFDIEPTGIIDIHT
ncbi:MAG: peptidoglycan-binding domain-containing protein, partial [Anaerovorax sp.]